MLRHGRFPARTVCGQVVGRQILLEQAMAEAQRPRPVDQQLGVAPQADDVGGLQVAGAAAAGQPFRRNPVDRISLLHRHHALFRHAISQPCQSCARLLYLHLFCQDTIPAGALRCRLVPFALQQRLNRLTQDPPLALLKHAALDDQLQPERIAAQAVGLQQTGTLQPLLNIVRVVAFAPVGLHKGAHGRVIQILNRVGGEFVQPVAGVFARARRDNHRRLVILPARQQAINLGQHQIAPLAQGLVQRVAQQHHVPLLHQIRQTPAQDLAAAPAGRVPHLVGREVCQFTVMVVAQAQQHGNAPAPAQAARPATGQLPGQPLQPGRLARARLAQHQRPPLAVRAIQHHLIQQRHHVAPPAVVGKEFGRRRRIAAVGHLEACKIGLPTLEFRVFGQRAQIPEPVPAPVPGQIAPFLLTNFQEREKAYQKRKQRLKRKIGRETTSLTTCGKKPDRSN